MMAGISLTFVVSVFVMSSVHGEAPHDIRQCKDDVVTRDAVFQAAATIMALTVFGSVFGVRIYQQVSTVRRAAKIILLIAIMSMIVIQVYVMGSLFYEDVGFDPRLWALFTGISLMTIVGGLALLGWGRDSATTSQQT